MVNMKKISCVITVICLIITLVSCNNARQQKEETSSAKPFSNITDCRQAIDDRINGYYNQNEKTLYNLATAFLQSGYTGIEFKEETVLVYDGTEVTELSINDIDSGLKNYYSLVDPFFDQIYLSRSNTWIFGINCVVFDDKSVESVDDKLTIQGELCFGVKLSSNYDNSYSDYISELSEDWIIFFNMMENDIQYMQHH